MGSRRHAQEWPESSNPTNHRIREESDCGPRGHRERIVHELSAELFASFARRDQRIKGEKYLRGLLEAEGRKSVRNIAASGGAAAEQSLHHFISSSTWDWRPVRRALAGYLCRAGSPKAWVVRSMPIPKSGRQSVGVGLAFDDRTGRAFRGQHALGVWYASETSTAPVHWRLILSGPWLRDGSWRSQAQIPPDAAEETTDECATAAALHTVGRWFAPRPVVLDPPVEAVGPTVGRFTDAGVPVIARVSGQTPLTVLDTAHPGHGAGPHPARGILDSVAGLRRPTGHRGRRMATLAVRVRPEPGGARDDGLLLVGDWGGGRQSPATWVTNMTSVPAPILRGYTSLVERVDLSTDAIGSVAGLRDYEGRSFGGWHRHITLASAAYAAFALTADDPQRCHAELCSA